MKVDQRKLSIARVRRFLGSRHSYPSSGRPLFIRVCWFPWPLIARHVVWGARVFQDEMDAFLDDIQDIEKASAEFDETLSQANQRAINSRRWSPTFTQTSKNKDLVWSNKNINGLNKYWNRVTKCRKLPSTSTRLQKLQKLQKCKLHCFLQRGRSWMTLLQLKRRPEERAGGLEGAHGGPLCGTSEGFERCFVGVLWFVDFVAWFVYVRPSPQKNQETTIIPRCFGIMGPSCSTEGWFFTFVISYLCKDVCLQLWGILKMLGNCFTSTVLPKGVSRCEFCFLLGLSRKTIRGMTFLSKELLNHGFWGVGFGAP